MNKPRDNARRDFLKKSIYVVPVILTLKAAPALAGIGSPQTGHEQGPDRSKAGRKNKHGGFRGLVDSIIKAFKF